VAKLDLGDQVHRRLSACIPWSGGCL